MKQNLLPLFEIDREYRMVLTLRGKSAHDASKILKEILLQEGRCGATFYDIVKTKMGIHGAEIPESLVRPFADQIDAVCQDRHRIKSIMADDYGLQLVIVDKFGRPCETGTGPSGFALHNSPSGKLAAAKQYKMTTRKLEETQRKAIEVGVLTPAQAVAETQRLSKPYRDLLPEAGK